MIIDEDGETTVSCHDGVVTNNESRGTLMVSTDRVEETTEIVDRFCSMVESGDYTSLILDVEMPNVESAVRLRKHAELDEYVKMATSQVNKPCSWSITFHG